MYLSSFFCKVSGHGPDRFTEKLIHTEFWIKIVQVSQTDDWMSFPEVWVRLSDSLPNSEKSDFLMDEFSNNTVYLMRRNFANEVKLNQVLAGLGWFGLVQTGSKEDWCMYSIILMVREIAGSEMHRPIVAGADIL